MEVRQLSPVDEGRSGRRGLGGTIEDGWREWSVKASRVHWKTLLSWSACGRSAFCTISTMSSSSLLQFQPGSLFGFLEQSTPSCSQMQMLCSSLTEQKTDELFKELSLQKLRWYYWPPDIDKLQVKILYITIDSTPEDSTYFLRIKISSLGSLEHFLRIFEDKNCLSWADHI